MALFGKKKNKQTEAEEVNLAANDDNTSWSHGDFDSLFSKQDDEDMDLFGGADVSEDDLQAFFDQYMAEETSKTAAKTPAEEKSASKTSVKVESDDIKIDAEEYGNVLGADLEGFNLTERESKTSAKKTPVTSVAVEETYVEKNIKPEPVTVEPEEIKAEAKPSEQPEEKRELTTDEAIEEFLKNISLGGNISELLGDTESVSEDGLEIPSFASPATEEAEADSVENPVDIALPVEIADSEINEPQVDGVGSTDMNLRIAFGLEEEEESEEVKDAVKKMGDRFEANTRIAKQVQPDHPEYTDPTQARDIAAEYKGKMRSVNARLILSLIAALVLLVYENIPIITELITGFPKQFAGVLDPAVYPVVYMMVSLQLLFICAVFALPELFRGVKKIFKGSPTPESISAFAVTAAAGTTLVGAYFADVSVGIVMYNSVAAMSVVMALIYSRLNIKREMITFFIAGSKKKKYAMNRVPENETLLSPDSYEDDMYGDVMRVERTGFIDGFFSRVCTPDGMTTAFTAALMGIAVAAAVLFGVFTGKGDNAGFNVASTVNVVVLALLPLSAHVTFSYPFYRASRAASEWDSAIVGETSLEEYAATAVVSFDDGNVFPSFGVKVQNIKIYNNARIDRVLYYASSAFKYAGGPLADVFEVATMELGRSENVEITDADKGYLAATVDGVNIVFGSYPALIQKGFDISDSIALDDVDFSDELSIMYMFREDMLIAKFYIKYVLDGDIEPIIRQFQDYGMYLCVRTYDPNIDEDMICAKLQLKNPPVKVVRYRRVDDVRGVMERVDSGFVTYGSPKSLLQLLPYCDKTIHTKRTCGALSIMAVVIALMMLAVFSMSSGISMLNSLYITLYHLVWVFFSYVASKLFIR